MAFLKLEKANKFAKAAETQGVANMASLLVSVATRSSRSRAATASATRLAGTPVATTAAVVKGQEKPTGVAPSERSTTVPSGSGGHSTVDEHGSESESLFGEAHDGEGSGGSESDDIGDDAGRELKSLRAIMRREELAESGRLVGMDLVEVNPGLEPGTPPRGAMHGDNPDLEPTTPTVLLAVELVLSALGKTIMADHTLPDHTASVDHPGRAYTALPVH